MNTRQIIAAALDPALLFQVRGMRADPWQSDILRCQDRHVLLNCCRQSGKSTTVSTVALHTALYHPGSLTLIVSPGQRQSEEIFRKVKEAYNALERPIEARSETASHLELVHRGRIVGLPGREETIRGYSGVNLLIIDEASRVPDDLYRSVRPMLAVSQGRLIALSTPFGQRGWFFEEWQGSGSWKRVKVPWSDCPRISASFIADEVRAMGQAWVDQEYHGLFTALEGLVYPHFERAFAMDAGLRSGQQVGGIDWGWRNPFAALWGVLDADDVLWIQGERYLRETPLHEHCKALPKIMWYADPAGRTEIEEFRAAGHTIRKGINDLRAGIAAVHARLRTGRLKVDAARCPNLVAEARLYRYPSGSERSVLGENPIDENNHALAALRYLVSRLDHRFIARLRKAPGASAAGSTDAAGAEALEDRSASAPSGSRRSASAPTSRSLTDPNLWSPLN